MEAILERARLRCGVRAAVVTAVPQLDLHQ
jgi:hypothetical protein